MFMLASLISAKLLTLNHDILMLKLVEYGIPLMYVNVIHFMYSNHIVNVKFGSFVSSEWKIKNGFVRVVYCQAYILISSSSFSYYVHCFSPFIKGYARCLLLKVFDWHWDRPMVDPLWFAGPNSVEIPLDYVQSAALLTVPPPSQIYVIFCQPFCIYLVIHARRHE